MCEKEEEEMRVFFSAVFIFKCQRERKKAMGVILKRPTVRHLRGCCLIRGCLFSFLLFLIKFTCVCVCSGSLFFPYFFATIRKGGAKMIFYEKIKREMM